MCLVGRRGASIRLAAGPPATSRVRTLAFGVIVDPNISQPLPFAGLSYLDFNLFGTGTQFNGFFGGSYGQVAFSVPSIARSRWQIAGRAFGIASSITTARSRADASNTTATSGSVRRPRRCGWFGR